MKHDAQLDYYGKRLATASSDKTIRIFDISGSMQSADGQQSQPDHSQYYAAQSQGLAAQHGGHRLLQVLTGYCRR
jgi:WD40 repeat protein